MRFSEGKILYDTSSEKTPKRLNVLDVFVCIFNMNKLSYVVWLYASICFQMCAHSRLHIVLLRVHIMYKYVRMPGLFTIASLRVHTMYKCNII